MSVTLAETSTLDAKAVRLGLHALSQPLTTLLFCLEFAQSECKDELLRPTLLQAQAEYRRAVDLFEKLRTLVREADVDTLTI